MKMKPMVYRDYGTSDPELLYYYYDIINEFEIAIINRGSHPCGYIRVPDEMLEKARKIACEMDASVDDYDNWYADVHYGLTYAELGRPFDDDRLTSGLWIGWDYAHLGDRYGLRWRHPCEKAWTTEEIFEEALNALDSVRFCLGEREEE